MNHLINDYDQLIEYFLTVCASLFVIWMFIELLASFDFAEPYVNLLRKYLLSGFKFLLNLLMVLIHNVTIKSMEFLGVRDAHGVSRIEYVVTVIVYQMFMVILFAFNELVKLLCNGVPYIEYVPKIFHYGLVSVICLQIVYILFGLYHMFKKIN